MLTYLPRSDVVEAAAAFDAAAVVARALVLHAEKGTTLSDEAYLGWTTPGGMAARSLALPGALWGDEPVIGVKVINSSLGNTARHIPRAQGLTLLFDPETAHPYAVVEAAYLSVLRTAAYTALSVGCLANPSVGRVAIIGCGAIGRAHVELLHRLVPAATFTLFDIDPARLAVAAEELGEASVQCAAVPSAEAAVVDADVVVTATTTTTGYLPFGWLAPGALVAHVSLDDVLPDVVARADLVVVDDWDLVRNDQHRLLGRLHRAGKLVGPEDGPTGPVATGGRAVDSTLPAVLAGRHPGRTDPRQVILSNPFGMGILDVAFAAEVVRVAIERGLGTRLPV